MCIGFKVLLWVLRYFSIAKKLLASTKIHELGFWPLVFVLFYCLFAFHGYFGAFC